jgi:citrate lyase synthetase
MYNFRLCLACGGMAVNSLEDLTVDCLGRAGHVFEYTLVSSSVDHDYEVNTKPVFNINLLIHILHFKV